MAGAKTVLTGSGSNLPTKAKGAQDGKKIMLASTVPVGIGSPTPRRTLKADPTKEYVSGGSYYWLTQFLRTLPHYIDDVTRDFGDDLYDRMMQDAKVSQCMEAVRFDSLSQGLSFLPAVSKGDKGYDKAVEIRDFCQRVLDAMETPLIEEVLDPLMDALPYGNAVAEKIYHTPTSGPLTGYLVLKAIKHKPRRSYAFVVDAYNNVVGLLGRLADHFSPMLVEGAMVSTNLPNFLPREKFVIARFRPRGGDPRGRSLLRPAYTPWWLKQQGYPGYLKFMAQWASPSLWATTPEQAAPEQQLDPATGEPLVDDYGMPKMLTPEDALGAQLEQFQNGSWLVTPYGSQLQPIQVAGEGAPFAEFNAWCDSQIELAITLQSLATSEGTHMARAAAEVHQDTLGFAVQVAKGTFERMVERDILRQIVEINYGEKYLWLTPKASLSETEQHDFATEGKVIADLWEDGYLDVSQLPDIDARLGLPERSEEDLEMRQQKAAAVAQQEIAGAQAAVAQSQAGVLPQGPGGPGAPPPTSPGGAGGPGAPPGPAMPPPASGDPDPAAAMGGYVPSLADTGPFTGAKAKKGEETDDSQTVLKLLQDAGINPAEFIKEMYAQGPVGFSLARECKRLGLPLALFGLGKPEVALFSVVDETNGHFIHVNGHSIWQKGAEQATGHDGPADAAKPMAVTGEKPKAGGPAPMNPLPMELAGTPNPLTSGPAPMHTGPAPMALAPMKTAMPAATTPTAAPKAPGVPAPGAMTPPAAPAASVPPPAAATPVAPEHVTQALQISGPKMSKAGGAKLKQLVNNGTIGSTQALHHTLAIAHAINQHHVAQPGSNPHAQVSPWGIEVAAKFQHIPTLLAHAEGKAESDPSTVKLAKKLKPYLEKMIGEAPEPGHIQVNPHDEMPTPAMPAPMAATSPAGAPAATPAAPSAPAATTAKPAGAPDEHDDIVNAGFNHSNPRDPSALHTYYKAGHGSVGKSKTSGKWISEPNTGVTGVHDTIKEAMDNLKHPWEDKTKKTEDAKEPERTSKPEGHKQLTDAGWKHEAPASATGVHAYNKGDKFLTHDHDTGKWKSFSTASGSGSDFDEKEHDTLDAALAHHGEATKHPKAPMEHEMLTKAGWKADTDENGPVLYKKGGKKLIWGPSSKKWKAAWEERGLTQTTAHLGDALKHIEEKDAFEESDKPKAADKAPDGAPDEHNDLVGAGWQHSKNLSGLVHKYKHPSGKVMLKHYNNGDETPWQVSHAAPGNPMAYGGDFETLPKALKRASSLHTPEHEKLVKAGFTHTGGNHYGGGTYQSAGGDYLSHKPGDPKGEWHATNQLMEDSHHPDLKSALGELGHHVRGVTEHPGPADAQPQHKKLLADGWTYRPGFTGSFHNYTKGNAKITHSHLSTWPWQASYQDGSGLMDNSAHDSLEDAIKHLETKTPHGITGDATAKPEEAPQEHDALVADGWKYAHIKNLGLHQYKKGQMVLVHDDDTPFEGWSLALATMPGSVHLLYGETVAEAFAKAGIPDEAPNEDASATAGAPMPQDHGDLDGHKLLVDAGWKAEDYTYSTRYTKPKATGWGSDKIVHYKPYPPGSPDPGDEGNWTVGFDPKQYDSGGAALASLSPSPAMNPHAGLDPEGNPAAHKKLLAAGFEHAGTGSFHTYVKRYGTDYHTLGHSANAAKKAKDQWIATTASEVKAHVPLKDALAHVGEDPEAVLTDTTPDTPEQVQQAHQKLQAEGWGGKDTPTGGRVFKKKVGHLEAILYWSPIENGWQGEVTGGALPQFKKVPNFDTAYKNVMDALDESDAAGSTGGWGSVGTSTGGGDDTDDMIHSPFVSSADHKKLTDAGWTLQPDTSYEKDGYTIHLEDSEAQGMEVWQAHDPDGNLVEEATDLDSVLEGFNEEMEIGTKLDAALAAGAPSGGPDTTALYNYLDGKKLASTNTNAPSHNKKIEALQEAVAAKDAQAILNMAFGTNTYGKKQVAAANRVLKALGMTTHKVVPGQKAGTGGVARGGATDDPFKTPKATLEAAGLNPPAEHDELLAAGWKFNGASPSKTWYGKGSKGLVKERGTWSTFAIGSAGAAQEHPTLAEALQKHGEAIASIPLPAPTATPAPASTWPYAPAVNDKDMSGLYLYFRGSTVPVKHKDIADLYAAGLQWDGDSMYPYFEVGDGLYSEYKIALSSNGWHIKGFGSPDGYYSSAAQAIASMADALKVAPPAPVTGASSASPSPAPPGAATPKVHAQLETLGWKFKTGMASNKGTYADMFGSVIMKENDGTWSLVPEYGAVKNGVHISTVMADAGEPLNDWDSVMKAEAQDSAGSSSGSPTTAPTDDVMMWAGKEMPMAHALAKGVLLSSIESAFKPLEADGWAIHNAPGNVLQIANDDEDILIQINKADLGTDKWVDTWNAGTTKAFVNVMADVAGYPDPSSQLGQAITKVINAEKNAKRAVTSPAPSALPTSSSSPSASGDWSAIPHIDANEESKLKARGWAWNGDEDEPKFTKGADAIYPNNFYDPDTDPGDDLYVPMWLWHTAHETGHAETIQSALDWIEASNDLGSVGLPAPTNEHYTNTGEPAPKPAGHWAGIPDVALPAGPGATGTPANSSGIILLNGDGRLWIRKVTNGFGGYVYSFAKGQVEAGLSEQQNAHKELYEEMGLDGAISDVLGTFQKTTGTAKYFIGTKTGGDPNKFEWETESVHLVTMDEAEKMLNHPSDKEVLAALKAHLAAKKKAGDTLTVKGTQYTDDPAPITDADMDAAKAMVSDSAKKYIDQAKDAGKVTSKGDLLQFVAVAEASSKKDGKSYISGYGMKDALTYPTLPNLLEAAEAGNADAQEIKAKLGAHTFKTAKEKWATLSPEDILSKKVKLLGGSNSAHLYETPSGEKHAVKVYAKETQAAGEALTNKVLGDLGIKAPQSAYFAHNGKHYYAAQYVEGASNLGTNPTQAQAREFLKGFAANSFLGNWDAIGLNGDNVMVLPTGDLMQIDNGGALLHSAMGAGKHEEALQRLHEWKNLGPESNVNGNFAKFWKAAGYDKIEDVPGIYGQMSKIAKLGAGAGGWKKYVSDAIPKASASTRKKLAELLEHRAGLIKQKLEAMQAEALADLDFDAAKSFVKTFASDYEAGNYFAVQDAALKSAATNGQKEAIKWWQDINNWHSGVHSGASSYSSVTQHMLYSHPGDPVAAWNTLSSASQAAMQDLQGLFLQPEASMPEMVALVRGIYLYDSNPEQKIKADHYKTLGPGDTFTWALPQSSQYFGHEDPEKWTEEKKSDFGGGNWQLFFYVPAGVGVAKPDSFSGTGSGEKEVLVGPNGKYKVLAPPVQNSSGRWVMHLLLTGYEPLPT